MISFNVSKQQQPSLLSLRWMVWVAAVLTVVQGKGSDDATNNTTATTTILNNENIREAVDAWISSPASAESTYGKIQDWDTSRVTDMQGLFQGRADFDDDLSQWNTSAVTNMANLFNRASSFHGNLAGWDTSHVQHMDGMFSFATQFTGESLAAWSTESLQSLDYAFGDATSFRGDISSWQTSKVRYMAFCFRNATSFSHDLSDWPVSQVDDMDGMFWNAAAFDKTLCWDPPEGVQVGTLFCGSHGALDVDCVSSSVLRESLESSECSDDHNAGAPQLLGESSTGGEEEDPGILSPSDAVALNDTASSS